MIERNIRFAVDYGVLFEINTVAFRKEWPSPYLAKDFVEVCVLLLTQGSAYVKSFSLIIHRHSKGRFTLSDDRHRDGPHHGAVGMN